MSEPQLKVQPNPADVMTHLFINLTRAEVFMT